MFFIQARILKMLSSFHLMLCLRECVHDAYKQNIFENHFLTFFFNISILDFSTHHNTTECKKKNENEK